jgi:hypothetical protein
VSKASPEPEGLAAGLKRAFTWHWHLLGLGAAAGVVVLSGAPLALLPFIAAAELGYLGFLGLNPRFQNILKAGGKTAPPSPADPRQRFQQLMAFLNPDDAARFDSLRRRCMDLLQLRRNMSAKTGSGVEDLRSESLDRMLWLFLKLLHQRSGLEKFLGATRRDEIEADLQSAGTQLANAESRDRDSGLPESRLTTSIRERVATIRERVENHRKAQDALELVSAEIDKTEQQITHLVETGMTATDSAGLTVQINTISESLQSSERIFSETSFAQMFDDEQAPPLLSGSIPPRVPVAQ